MVDGRGALDLGRIVRIVVIHRVREREAAATVEALRPQHVHDGRLTSSG